MSRVRILALAILAGAAALGGMSGYLFARGAAWEGAGVIACALALVGLSTWTVTGEGTP